MERNRDAAREYERQRKLLDEVIQELVQWHNGLQHTAIKERELLGSVLRLACAHRVNMDSYRDVVVSVLNESSGFPSADIYRVIWDYFLDPIQCELSRFLSLVGILRSRRGHAVDLKAVPLLLPPQTDPHLLSHGSSGPIPSRLYDARVDPNTEPRSLLEADLAWLQSRRNSPVDAHAYSDEWGWVDEDFEVEDIFDQEYAEEVRKYEMEETSELEGDILGFFSSEDENTDWEIQGLWDGRPW